MSKFIKGKKLGTWDDTKDAFVAILGGLDHEELHVLWLDSHGNIIEAECMATGNEREVAVPMLKILERGQELGAARFILSHNHPGEEEKPIPSMNDIKTTIAAGTMGFTRGLNLLDHIVVGKQKGTSIAMEVLGMYR